MDKNFYNEYMRVFLEENQKVNLISKNDEQFLWEKHIFDSLSLEKFFSRHAKVDSGTLKLLDIGTGGGFPSVPIALTYPEIEVYALDSIRKKINAIEAIKSKLNIKNLHTICDRAENIKQKFDIVTTRAVSSLKNVTHYAMPLLEKDGYFIAFKSKKALEEIEEAKPVLKRFRAEIIDIIEYELPLEENHSRNLIIIKHSK